MTEGEIAHLMKVLSDPALWKIRKRFDGVTFFYYTDAQLAAHQAKDTRDIYMREYSHLTEPYDEFGYLKRRGIVVGLDSKENFDNNYHSSWFYYDR